MATICPLLIQGQSFQVIGVVSKGFSGIDVGAMPDIWFPLTMWQPTEGLISPDWRNFRIMGRMREGVAREQLTARMQAVYSDALKDKVTRAFPDGRIPEQAQKYLSLQIAVRPAPSGPSRLRGQFVDSLLLGALASAAGLLLALRAAPSVVGLLEESNNPVRVALNADWRVFGFLLFTCLVTTLACGLVPASRALGTEPNAELRGTRVRPPGPLAGRLYCAYSKWGLFSGNRRTAFFGLPGESATAIETINLGVSPGFFEAMGTRLLRGRDFLPGDERGGSASIIVNQAVARRLFPDGEPIGKLLSHSALPPAQAASRSS